MRAFLFGFVALASSPAPAEVLASSPNGFHLRQSVQVPVPPSTAFDIFEQIGSWWDPSHTYSGDASRLRLSATPGGCFCENLPGGGGIEHMRVIFANPAKRLVLGGSLGPLLYEATTGAMDVKFDQTAEGATITMDYKVSGFATGGAERLAPAVDQVLAGLLLRYRLAAQAKSRR